MPISESERAEFNSTDLEHALAERVKELNCLFGIGQVVERHRDSLENTLQGIVNLLPESWEHPQNACARIELDGLDFKTDNYSKCQWSQVATLSVHKESVGIVEVGYLQERPEQDEGPFLSEERALLNAVAQRTGHIIELFRGDQTARQREAELRERLTHLTRVSTLGEMASSIAHEVNQPLTAIATYSQACVRMLNAGTSSAKEISDILGRVTDEAVRASGIIHRLKNLARRHASNRSECDVNELVRDLVQLASVDTRLHSVDLELQLSESLPQVIADGIQIQQVVLNLIRNGVDALADSDRDDRRIVVRTVERKDRKVEISVTDNGCGLPTECDDELFEPFFTTKKQGLGMGLSVSRSIITSHGGQMWFSRLQSGGTTFFLTVPVPAEDCDD